MEEQQIKLGELISLDKPNYCRLKTWFTYKNGDHFYITLKQLDDEILISDEGHTLFGYSQHPNPLTLNRYFCEYNNEEIFKTFRANLDNDEINRLITDFIQCLCEVQTEIINDSVVEQVVRKHLYRAEKGLSKYGVNMDRNDLTVKQWLIHFQEEAMDMAVYAQKLANFFGKE